MRVLGIGNALTDYLYRLDSDDILKQLGLPKGSMQLVDKQKSNEIIEKIGIAPEQISAGGSAANTIHGLAKLGIDTAFIGKAGLDKIGNEFKESLEKSNILPLLLNSENDSGVAIALISPDGERTFATFLGAAIELDENDISEGQLVNFDIVHIEGYLVQNHNLVRKIVSLCKKNEITVSIDLASYNVVKENIDFLKEIVTDYANIVFANEEEAFEFTGMHDEKALNEISKLADIAIVKLGSQGSIIKSKENMKRIEVFPATCLDTTGAGDLYASGFLFGYIKSMNLSECGIIGSLLAGHVIEELGAKIPDQRWQIIHETLGII